jgi:hypothetical protein
MHGGVLWKNFSFPFHLVFGRFPETWPPRFAASIALWSRFVALHSTIPKVKVGTVSHIPMIIETYLQVMQPFLDLGAEALGPLDLEIGETLPLIMSGS